MKKSTRNIVSETTAWSVGLVLFAIVFVSGGLSLYINVAVGMSMGVVAAVMFALGDIAKMVLPISMVAIGRTVLMRSIYWLAVVVSFGCAFFATADMFGAKFVETYTMKKTETLGASHIATLTQTLTAARESLKDATEKSAKGIEDLRATLNVTRGMMQKESEKKGCGNICTGHRNEVTRLEAEIKAALTSGCKTCETLQTEVTRLVNEVSVATAKQETKITPDMTGKALLGQMTFGIDASKIDTATTVSIVVFQMLMMELFSLMSSFAASTIGHAYSLTKARRKSKRGTAAKAKLKEVKATVDKLAVIDAKKAASLAKRRATIAAKKLAVVVEDETAKRLATADKIIAAKKLAQEKKNAAAAKRRAIAAEKKAAAEAKKIATAAKRAADRKIAAEKKVAQKNSQKVIRLVRDEEKASA